ncbi:hypothetical protein ACTXT7_013220 [Hymenolepis weldensis]
MCAKCAPELLNRPRRSSLQNALVSAFTFKQNQSPYYPLVLFTARADRRMMTPHPAISGRNFSEVFMRRRPKTSYIKCIFTPLYDNIPQNLDVGVQVWVLYRKHHRYG